MSEYEKLREQTERILEQHRLDSIKDHPLVKYVIDRGLVSVKKLCKIMDCDIEDITKNI